MKMKALSSCKKQNIGKSKKYSKNNIEKVDFIYV